MDVGCGHICVVVVVVVGVLVRPLRSLLSDWFLLLEVLPLLLLFGCCCWVVATITIVLRTRTETNIQKKSLRKTRNKVFSSKNTKQRPRPWEGGGTHYHAWT